MQVRSSISRIAVATMVAAMVAVPVASAMPADGVIYGSSEYAAEQQDMHASTVHKPESNAGDLRGEASIAGSQAAAEAKSKATTAAIKQDQRTEAAKGPSISTPPPGMPTWPLDPEPLTPPATPVSATNSDDGAIEWPIALLIGFGAVALAGALVVMVHQMRRTQTRPAR